MTEKILPYNRDLVAQETGYWCGPASAQMVLSDRGIHIDEMQLARECGTHEGGTDHLGLIEEVLNRYVHDADYITVWLRNDPPTDQEVEDFWNNLRTSIDNGFGLVLNFVAPLNNKPFPIKGSGPCPSFYDYGTTYHYVSAHGYSDEDGQRAVWIADSGGAPFGYWLTLAQTVLIAAGKGYIYARPHVAGVPVLPGPAAALDLAESLSLAMGGSLSIDRYRELVPGVLDALRASNCDNPRRIAQWFAQVGHESAGLRYMEELADGSAYEWREDLGNTQPGDGVKFKGHGPLQITGRENHRQVSEWAFARGLVPSPTYFIDFPQELGSDRYGFVGTAWYWTVARGDRINEAADREDIDQVTRLINGGLHGIDDRRNRYYTALQVADQFLQDHGQHDAPGIPTLPGPAPVPTQGRFHPVTADSFVTSPFGPRDGGFHSGVDFGFHGGSAGRPVFAVQSGTVQFSGAAQGYGGPDPAGWLVIDSDDSQGGGVWEYGHIIREPHLTVGARVTAGEQIGVINPSEASNGGVAPHLHLAYMPRAYNPGAKIDPLPVLDGAQEPGGLPPAPPPAPEPPPVVDPPSPSLSPQTSLTGRPWHHSVDQDIDGVLADIRAEGLITQALVFAIAEKSGLDARQIYNDVRGSF